MGQSGSHDQALAHQHRQREVAFAKRQKGRQPRAAQRRTHHIHAAHRGGPDKREIHRHQSQCQHRDAFVARQNLQHPVPRPQRHQTPQNRKVASLHQSVADRAEPCRLGQREQRHNPVSVLVNAGQIVGAEGGRRVQHRCAKIPLGDQIERGAGEPRLVGPGQIRVRAQDSDRDEHQQNGNDDFHGQPSLSPAQPGALDSK